LLLELLDQHWRDVAKPPIHEEFLQRSCTLLVILPTSLRCLRPRHKHFIDKLGEVFVTGGAIVFIIEDIPLDFGLCLFCFCPGPRFWDGLLDVVSS
jgi:hypothetical protein